MTLMVDTRVITRLASWHTASNWNLRAVAVCTCHREGNCAAGTVSVQVTAFPRLKLELTTGICNLNLSLVLRFGICLDKVLLAGQGGESTIRSTRHPVPALRSAI